VAITGSRCKKFKFLTEGFWCNWTASFGSPCISCCNKDQGYILCVTGFESTCSCLRFGKELWKSDSHAEHWIQVNVNYICASHYSIVCTERQGP
jgi:hypothetical protein